MKKRAMAEMTLNILLVDDNVDEHFFFRHSLLLVTRPIYFHALPGGQEMIEYFKNESNPLPDILFLDINMPMRNGRDCLSYIRSDVRLESVPVVMYSTSDSQRDIDDTYELGADLYVRKPNGMDAIRDMISSVIRIYERDQLKHSSKEVFLLAS